MRTHSLIRLADPPDRHLSETPASFTPRISPSASWYPLTVWRLNEKIRSASPRPVQAARPMDVQSQTSSTTQRQTFYAYPICLMTLILHAYQRPTIRHPQHPERPSLLPSDSSTRHPFTPAPDKIATTYRVLLNQPWMPPRQEASTTQMEYCDRPCENRHIALEPNHATRKSRANLIQRPTGPCIFQPSHQFSKPEREVQA